MQTGTWVTFHESIWFVVAYCMEHNVCNITYHSMDVALHSLRIPGGLYIPLYKYCHLHVLTIVIVLNGLLGRLTLNMYEVECTAGVATENWIILVGRSVGLYVLSVYLSICNIAGKRMNGFSWNYLDRSDMTQRTTRNICGMLRLPPWIHDIPLYLAGKSVSVS